MLLLTLLKLFYLSKQVSQLSEANSHLSARLTTTTKSIAQRETQLKQLQKKQDELNDDLNTEGKATNKLLHDLKYDHKRLTKNFEVSSQPVYPVG